MSLRIALEDIRSGVKNYEFWKTYALNDVKAKYRRSKLGQLWVTLSVAVFIFVIGGLFIGFFNSDVENYMAYLAVGYILWLFLSDCIQDGSMSLIQNAGFMRQKSWPVSTFALRTVCRELIVILHHVILLPPIFIFLKLWPGFAGLILSLLGFALCVFTAVWVVILVSIITLRYRDIPPILQSLIRMFFFATPIFWISRGGSRMMEILAVVNPFGYYLKIVRAPLLKEAIDPNDWFIAIAISLITMMVSLFVLSKTKKRLAYWL